ncbi:MAG: lysylphosphatidylglycerol synthase transmembrane domain-containing protein [Candidatus Saccharibacteria bacterium]|nr:lysylphosphatidylglycerol synthase transmembrane domain-containing protein [Candidatus Saccharibacteria bacterium]
MSKKYKRILSITTVSVLLAVFFWYINTNWDNFQQISLTNPWLLLPVILFIALNIYTMGYLIELAIEPHGVKLSKKEIFGLSALTRFSKQVTPGYIGLTVRAFYLKKSYGVSYAKFSSSLVLSNILQFVMSGLLAILIFTSLHSQPGAYSLPMLLIIIAVSLFLTTLYAPLSKLIGGLIRLHNKHSYKVLERLHAAAEEYDKVRKHPKFIYRSAFWALITLVTTGVNLFLLYRVLGFEIGIAQSLFIAALSSWTMIFSITPAGIGVKESLMALGATLMQVPVPITLTVAILNRLLTFLLVSALSGYFAPALLNTSLTKISRFK